MRAGIVVCLLPISCSVLAQVPPPGGGQAEFRIDFDARHKDIHWNGTFRPPSSKVTGTPIASFTMTCVPVSVPQNWVIQGYVWDGIELDIIEWENENPGVPYPDPHADYLRVSAPGTGQQIIGRGYRTDDYTTSCTVLYYDTILQSNMSYPVTTDKWVYVLGGPLEFKVKPPLPIYNHPNPPSRDAFGSGPNYLQYLGYDPDLLFQFGFPYELQRAQTGNVKLKWGQPGAVPMVEWTLAGPIEFVGPCDANPGAFTEIDVGATAASAPGAVTVDAKIWVTIDIDGTLLSVSSEIDPLEWPATFPTESQPAIEDDDVFRFTSHKPDTMEAIEPYLNPVVQQYYTNGPYGLAAVQYFEVYDTNGSPMPSLWVEERFTFNDPPYHWGDSHGPSVFEEPGLIYSDYATGYGTGFQTNWHPNGTDFVWTTTSPPADEKEAWQGVFGPDNLVITINVAWPYQNGANPPFFDFMHHYFAATRNAAPNATTGIPIGTYRLRMWTDKVLHEKQ